MIRSGERLMIVGSRERIMKADLFFDPVAKKGFLSIKGDPGTSSRRIRRTDLWPLCNIVNKNVKKKYELLNLFHMYFL